MNFGPVTRRDFVRVVPTLGAFVISAEGAEAQGDPLAWPAAPPPPAGSPVLERFPTQHDFLVKDVVTVAHSDPNVRSLRGPHGIPLITHARAGGPQAAQVLKFLESMPASSGVAPAIEPLSATDRSSIEGRYVFGDRPRDTFTVDFAQNTVGITRAGASRRILTYLGEMTFAPSGAAAVRITFNKTNSGMTLGVFDPALVVRAQKI